MKNVLILFFIIFFLSMEAKTKSQSFLPNSFNTSFTKKVKSVVGKKIIESKGEFDYKYPSQLILRYEEEKIKKTVVVSDSNVWDYTPPFIASEKGELSIYKNHKMPLLKFLDLLHEGLVKNKMFNFKSAGKNIDITFKSDMTAKYDFKSAKFIKKESAKEIKSLQDVQEIHLLYKTKTPNLEVYVFDDIQDKEFSSNYFKFETPKNTNVKTK